jgi:hypothetical protein
MPDDYRLQSDLAGNLGLRDEQQTFTDSAKQERVVRES